MNSELKNFFFGNLKYLTDVLFLEKRLMKSCTFGLNKNLIQTNKLGKIDEIIIFGAKFKIILKIFYYLIIKWTKFKGKEDRDKMLFYTIFE